MNPAVDQQLLCLIFEQIANAKPEQILREECNELRQEINKKDAAIIKHHEK